MRQHFFRHFSFFILHSTFKKELFILEEKEKSQAEILKEDVLPDLVHSPTDPIQSIRKTRDLQQVKGVRIIPGHDPVARTKFKLATAYYE